MNKVWIIWTIIVCATGISVAQMPHFKEFSLGELYKDVRINQ